MPRPATPSLTLERARELLDYDPATGVLKWKEGRRRGLKGAVAGTTAHGYCQLSIDDKRYYSHRVAWLIYYGTWPRDQIDHINGQHMDNRIANLREATASENQENQIKAKASNLSTGLLGVTWAYEDGFTARIQVNKVVHRLGTFRTAEAAHQAYLEAKRRLHAFNTL